MKLDNYIKVKDKCCILYMGFSKDNLERIYKILPKITQKYPDIEVTLACREQLVCSDIISESKLNKEEYGYVFEIGDSLHKDIIQEFLEKNEIDA